MDTDCGFSSSVQFLFPEWRHETKVAIVAEANTLVSAAGLKAIDSGGTESLQVVFGAFCGSARVMDLASTCQTGW